ncbi:MAG: LLM class flavin-dependent oxidoreductase [Deltaproteobacteria bacterium]|jgi:phthiodiolone/phenolphthiodiolone dimycocerosates ketoreductase|nr:LLM class flavin-dependent oxidoreductase [Deltaproteobacteria bacterium]MBW2500799.1 LLM class flavin-dependent oxidoreductase [Deltaproteobacteria bacterium]
MKIGLLLPTCHPWSINEVALATAEAANVDSVWTVDHLLGLFHPEIWAEHSAASPLTHPDAYLDPFVVSGVLGRTTRLEFGLAVTDSVRRRAADVARSALSVQQLCEGGFHLGVGCGEAQNLLPFGYDFEKPVARCEAFLRELRGLLDEGRMPDGGVGRLGIPLETAAGRPQVWVAAHGPRMLRLTGQYGDGWLPSWGLDAEEYGRRRSEVAQHAERAGRPTPTAGLVAITVLGESRQRIREMYDANPTAKLTAMAFPADRWHAYGLEHPDGPESRGMVDVIAHRHDADALRALAPKIPFELFEEGRFMGNVDELVERFGAFARQGMQHLVIANVTGSVGGAEEAAAGAAALPELVKRLGEL